MARKKLVSEEMREKTAKLKRLISLIIFLVMLLVIIAYGLGINDYLHPTPKSDPEVSSWGVSKEEPQGNDYEWEIPEDTEEITTKEEITTEELSEENSETSEELSEESLEKQISSEEN